VGLVDMKDFVAYLITLINSPQVLFSLLNDQTLLLGSFLTIPP
jgi:hypothetical protein